MSTNIKRVELRQHINERLNYWVLKTLDQKFYSQFKTDVDWHIRFWLMLNKGVNRV